MKVGKPVRGNRPEIEQRTGNTAALQWLNCNATTCRSVVGVVYLLLLVGSFICLGFGIACVVQPGGACNSTADGRDVINYTALLACGAALVFVASIPPIVFGVRACIASNNAGKLAKGAARWCLWAWEAVGSRVSRCYVCVHGFRSRLYQRVLQSVEAGLCCGDCQNPSTRAPHSLSTLPDHPPCVSLARDRCWPWRSAAPFSVTLCDGVAVSQPFLTTLLASLLRATDAGRGEAQLPSL
jgi:hypothetical protein